MCKIIIATNVSKMPDLDRFNEVCKELLRDHEDGYGMLVQGDKGPWGYRTTFEEREWIGTRGQVNGSALYHGRTSTNDISLSNTHPLLKRDTYIIHNGVVSNKGIAYDQTTTNDTEHILHHWLRGGIEEVAANLTGYYACGMLDTEGLLHVFRDAIAPLYKTELPSLECTLFASTTGILESLAGMLGVGTVIEQVPANTYYKYNGNNLVETKGFVSRGYEYSEAQWAEKSLGTVLDFPREGWSLSDEDDYIYDNISEEYLEEMEYMDESYSIRMGQREISIQEFLAMDIIDQVWCTVRRYDGSEMTPWVDKEERFA